MVVSTTFIIEGQVPAKKNSRQCFVRNGRMINIPSQRYKEWHDQAMLQLKGLSTFKPPYELVCVFYFRDRRPRDLDNALASVCDLLQDAKIIENDDAKLLTKVTAIYGGVSKKTPRVKIELYAQNA